LAVLVLNKKGS